MAIFRTTWVSQNQNTTNLYFIAARTMEVCGNYWSYKTCKAPVKLSPPTYHAQRLQVEYPSCRPTNSITALKGESITFHELAHSKLTWGFSILAFITIGSWLSWSEGYYESVCFVV